MNKKLKQLLIALTVLSTYSLVYAESKVAPKNAWITPGESTCKSKGGKFNGGFCVSTWEQAKNICRASGGRLPSASELVAVISECDGNTANNNSAGKENQEDTNYQSCYTKKGFSDTFRYWSSSTHLFYKAVEVMRFYDGYMDYHSETSRSNVRCVR